MATFVLVHGAWHGGWCWAKLESAMRKRGHETHAPTLTGLGERSHLLGKDITPDDHVTDIVNTLRWRDLSDVFLVGHSYGGMVISGVAGRVPERIVGLVYLDAFVPEQSGFSLFAQANPERMKTFQRQIDAGAEGLEPDNFDAWTNDPKTKAWLKNMCTPHPTGCFSNGVTLTGREKEITQKLYIHCARNTPSPFVSEYQKVKSRSDWETAEIATKHNAMGEDPESLAALLDKFVV
ncbi:MAG: alpha/beta hydrolase [Pseudomonadota bacterium]